jgi:hypothetical protein
VILYIKNQDERGIDVMNLFIEKAFKPSKELIKTAASHGAPKMLGLMLKNFQHKQLRDLDQLQLLQRATTSCKVENLRLLLDEGFNVDYILQTVYNQILVIGQRQRCIQLRRITGLI